MFETIVRLTDEQEALLRRSANPTRSEEVSLIGLRRNLENQVRDALALYDELVAEAEAKAASDD